MKTLMMTFILTVAISLCHRALGQNAITGVQWQNGNVTILNDLGEVWIILKKGGTIKKARVWEIDGAKGKIIYQKNGCLHDLFMRDIDKIYAGRNSRSEIYFQEDNNPGIKESPEYDYYSTETSDFKVSYKASEINLVQKSEAQVNSQNINDTLVKSGGEIVIAKIIKITENEISYKRTDIPDGPVYNISNNSATEVVKYQNCVKVILRKAY